ncbi:NADH-quinone oxidoreductase subunit L [Alphaproteobacteria bacterium SO-S41]|nr:NADH-quinone oxidoreductase subunit L [Alphaproteobacteria bacterium SO-S41]
MLSAIVFLPLLGALVAGFFGRLIGARMAEIVTTSLLGVAAVLSWMAFIRIGLNGGEPETIQVATWISSGLFEAGWTLRIDTLTVVMLVVVNTVSSLVHLYSIGYMAEDPHRPRFFAYLSLFTFAMLMLVTSDNFLQLFFGWEGVGLASYLLIGFWYQKPSANAAAIKAFVVNRVGDFGFALGIVGIFAVYGTISFDEVFAATPAMVGRTFEFAGTQFDVVTTLTFLLFIGAMGKSAQFGLHTWLPDAMEGPTPVSALIHAATMVTAGVFLVCRCSPMFEYAPDTLAFVTIIGAITAFFAATVGMFQNDIKRVIAYSTCSQLGYMFFAAGVSAYQAAMFHLFTHAFFKALLFLGAGSVIHAMHHEQDMRKMGGLYKLIPFTYAMMTIGTIALIGFGIPEIGGFAGFYSKDAILETAYAAGGVGSFGFVAGIVAALMTSFYSWRLAFMTFHGAPKWKHDAAHAHDDHAHVDAAHDEHHHHELHPHESPLTMTIPLAILALGAVAAGFVFYPYFIGDGNLETFWRGSIFVLHGEHVLHARHEVPEWVIWAPLTVTVLGFLIAAYYFLWYPKKAAALAAREGLLYNFLKNKWYIDELYNLIFVRPALWIGRKLWKLGDGWLIDGFGPDGVAARVKDLAGRAGRLQTGFIYHYAFAMLIGVAALLTWLMFGGAPK